MIGLKKLANGIDNTTAWETIPQICCYHIPLPIMEILPSRTDRDEQADIAMAQADYDAAEKCRLDVIRINELKQIKAIIKSSTDMDKLYRCRAEAGVKISRRRTEKLPGSVFRLTGRMGFSSA